MAIGKVVIALEGQHAKFTQATDESKVALEYFRKKVKETHADVSGLRGALDSLKSGAGRGSTLDELGKTLRGAGAVAGISLMGEALNKTAGEAAQLNEQFRKGQVDAAGIAVEMGKSLPVIGGFVSAGQSIREMFTHDKEQIDDMNSSAKLGNELMEARVKIVRESAKAIAELAKTAERANDKAHAMTLTGEDRKKFEVQVDFKLQAEDLHTKIDDDVRAIDDQVKSQRDKLSATLTDMRTRLANSAQGSEVYKELSGNVAQLQGTMNGLSNTAEKQKVAIRAAGEATAKALQDDYKIAEAAPLHDYFEKLQQKLNDLNPDPIAKMAAEVKKLGGTSADVQTAIVMAADASAAEQYKKNAEGLKGWAKELDETAAKIQALRSGADEKAAESFAKFAGADGAQEVQIRAMANQQAAQDAVLKKMEDQKKTAEEIAKLQTDVASFGLDAAGKTLAEMKGASAEQVAQVKALQDQLAVMEQQKKVKADLAAMEKELAQVGMTEAQKKFDDLARSGATGDQLAYAKHMADQTDAAREQQKLMDEGKKLMEEGVTPLEKYGQQVAKLDQMLAANAIDQKTYDEQTAKDYKELHKKDTDSANKGVEKIERRFDFRLPTKQHDANDPATLALKEHKKATGHLASISKKVGKPPKVASI